MKAADEMERTILRKEFPIYLLSIFMLLFKK